MLSVCLSACITLKSTRPNLPNFLRMLPKALTRSSFGGGAIGYVLPVLLMMPCFHVMAVSRVVHVYCFRKRRANSTYIVAEILTKFCSAIKTGSTRCDLRTVNTSGLYR